MPCARRGRRERGRRRRGCRGAGSEQPAVSACAEDAEVAGSEGERAEDAENAGCEGASTEDAENAFFNFIILYSAVFGHDSLNTHSLS